MAGSAASRQLNPELMLPIRRIEGQIAAHLKAGNRLVLSAPTGSGKTTQIPQILLANSPGSGQILVLQPRRLATRLVARRVACELQTPIGQLVGYQTRHDSQISASTRIRFVTEGLFLRLLHSRPTLAGVEAVVLDEFHERSLEADTALGLLRRLQESERPDLRLVVMSATLNTAALAAALECPVLETQGRTYPVEIRYIAATDSKPPWERATAALRNLLESNAEGDVLIFMPGAYEIRRTIETARKSLRDFAASLKFFPLHGSLSASQQDAAMEFSAQRKIIVATNVAETSITIEGVRHVIDSGLARIHRHDPHRGIDVLLVEAISAAATEQRAGRAGRTAPGTCTRLWERSEQEIRPAHDSPEIRRLDLADALLQLKALGIAELRLFPWLEKPEDEALDRAHHLLKDLGALDAAGGLTALGAQMASLPLHPRLSRLLIAAAQYRCLKRAAIWAALIGERDVLTYPLQGRYTQAPEGDIPSDLVVRERAYQHARKHDFEPSACAAAGIHANNCRQVENSVRLYLDAARRAGLKTTETGSSRDLVKCLLVAFFDRVALRRDIATLHCAMAGQRRVELDRHSAACSSPALVALEVRELEARGNSAVRTALALASGIETSWLEEMHPDRIKISDETTWNSATNAVEQHRLHAYDDLVYRRQPLAEIDALAAEEILVEQIALNNISLDKWNGEVAQWIYRTRLIARLFPERGLICYDEEEKRVILLEIVAGATRLSHIRTRPCLPHVQNALSWPDRQFVEKMAPSQLRLPSGVRLQIEYFDNAPPRGRAKIQELYDLQHTPAIARGRQKLLLEILGPNFRPVQITDDLAGFWEHTYPEVKRELKRRYPKHEWR